MSTNLVPPTHLISLLTLLNDCYYFVGVIESNLLHTFGLPCDFFFKVEVGFLLFAYSCDFFFKSKNLLLTFKPY